MHRYITVSITALLTVLVASCNKDASVMLTEGGDELITFVEAEHETKAAEVSTLTSFNVLCVTGEPGHSENSVFNSVFTIGADGKYVAGEFWTIDDHGYKFYASNMAMTLTSSGPVVSADVNTDMVCAACLAPVFRATNSLVFDHVLARIGAVTVNAPSTYTVSDLTVKLNSRNIGTYNVFAGIGKTDGTGWSDVSGTSVLTVASKTGANNNNIYLVPGIATLEATYTLTKGGYVETFTKHADVLLQKGKVNTITTTLPQGFAEPIVFNVGLVDWTDNNITPSLVLE